MTSMLEYAHPMFSINQYDKDGDLLDGGEGIFLHYGDMSIKVASTLAGWQAHLELLQGMTGEIIENYGE